MRRFLIVACLMAGMVAVPAWASADTITLVNGVEIRNAKITSETDHIVIVEIIGITRLVLGRSEVASLTRSDKKSVPRPAPPPSVPATPDVPPEPYVPESTPTVSVQPLEPVTPSFRPPTGLAPPPQSKSMTQILKVATRHEGIMIEFHVMTSPETGITYTVRASQPPPTLGNRTYTIKAIDGTPIKIVLNWDSSGKVNDFAVSPPEPPSDTMEGVFDYTLVTVGGEKFRMRAIWDVLNVELLETKIIL